jgi:hypothetical protein
LVNNLPTLRKAKGMLNLTKEDIQSDIKGFEDRICVAQQKLSLLPSVASTYKERRKIKCKKLILMKEIDHVRGLISIAEEALNQHVYSKKENSKNGKSTQRARRLKEHRTAV